MAMAVHSAETGSRGLLNVFLVCTMFLGAVFLCIKFTESYLHYLDHRVPGPGFHFGGVNAANVQMFFFLYFAMTGLHALHTFVGDSPIS